MIDFQSNIFSHSQHGLRQKRSTVTTSAQFINSLLQAFEKGDSCHLHYLDYQRFYSVSHSILYFCLRSLFNAYGIKGRVLQLITSYLSERQVSISIAYSKIVCFARCTPGFYCRTNIVPNYDQRFYRADSRGYKSSVLGILHTKLLGTWLQHLRWLCGLR